MLIEQEFVLCISKLKQNELTHLTGHVPMGTIGCTVQEYKNETLMILHSGTPGWFFSPYTMHVYSREGYSKKEGCTIEKII